MEQGKSQPTCEGLRVDETALNALEAHIAIVDTEGRIVWVNDRWRDFGRANGLTDQDYCVGGNYFSTCRASTDPVARRAMRGIGQVLEGARPDFYLEYPCHSPWQKRWFALWATPLPGQPGHALLLHENITDFVDED